MSDDSLYGRVDPPRRLHDPDFGDLDCYFEREFDDSGRLIPAGYEWRSEGLLDDPDPAFSIEGQLDGYVVGAMERATVLRLVATKDDVRRLIVSRCRDRAEDYVLALGLDGDPAIVFEQALHLTWVNIELRRSPQAVSLCFRDRWSDTFFVATYDLQTGALIEFDFD